MFTGTTLLTERNLHQQVRRQTNDHHDPERENRKTQTNNN